MASRDGGKLVYEQLRDAVTSGRYLPNERLVETALAESLGANRLTIREALARLEQEGLVERQVNRGARVRHVTLEEALEIVEVRGVLEGLAARRAATRASVEDVGRLREILHRLQEHRAASEFPSYSKANQELHRVVHDIAGSRPLVRHAQMLRSQSSQYRFWTLLIPGRVDQSFREHQAIVEAVARCDPDAAEHAARTHLAGVMEAIRQAAQITGASDAVSESTSV